MNRKLKKFEEFTQDTLNRNNLVYDKFFNNGKSDAEKVAWENRGSDIINYKLVSKHIKSGSTLLDYGCGMGDFLKFLDKKQIKISSYLGVDINENFINAAKLKYTDRDFKLIKSVNEIKGSWDHVCAIGVFTWYIKKDEFIQTIRKLHSLCNESVIITLLDAQFLGTPYDNVQVSEIEEEKFWSRQYRYYNDKLFYKLFPEFTDKFDFDKKENTLLVKISK